MRSAVITSGEHWVTINGIEYLRGTIETIEKLTYNDGKQGIKISGSSVNASVILVDGTTIDGTEVTSQQELVDFIKEHSFLDNGGDSGIGAVEWNNVQNKPLHTLGTPIEDAEGMVAVYTQDGQLPVGNPQFPENATPLYLVQFLIEEAYNNSKATVQEIQEGTNDQKHITPYLLKTFVEWFSSQLLLIDESYTDMPTSEQVNEKYPNARVRTLLYLPNAGSGMKYTKLNETQWESQPYTIA